MIMKTHQTFSGPGVSSHLHSVSVSSLQVHLVLTLHFDPLQSLEHPYCLADSFGNDGGDGVNDGDVGNVTETDSLLLCCLLILDVLEVDSGLAPA
jgi:hypothetical protein